METTALIVDIVDYVPEYRDDFTRLNAEWMTSFFGKQLDDHLDNPEETIINQGGFILFAKLGDEVIGTCAILKENNKLYEIADMAVAPQYRGKHIGKRLLSAAVDKVRKTGARQVYLITSSKLTVSLEFFRTYGFKETGFDAEMSVYEGSDVKMSLNLK
ncbi:MAG: GNAT family N-acetyltransferase [Saprospiraceae bacterium]|nr:GNAT family N-acetyltransferase [Saprospiraceae bacterium]